MKVEPAGDWDIDGLVGGRLGEVGGTGPPCVTVGEILRNDLNPTYNR